MSKTKSVIGAAMMIASIAGNEGLNSMMFDDDFRFEGPNPVERSHMRKVTPDIIKNERPEFWEKLERQNNHSFDLDLDQARIWQDADGVVYCYVDVEPDICFEFDGIGWQLLDAI